MPHFSRRAVLGSLPVALSTATLAGRAQADAHDNAFKFEVTRTEEEWRAMLSDDEYTILRDGGTEIPKTDPLWESTEAGMYSCKGCDLPVYDARWKVVLPIGFLFFKHSEPQTVLTSIDTSVYGQLGGRAASMGPIVPEALPADMTEEEIKALDSLLLVEVHCRRCASHLGHLVIAQGQLVHCINGTSLNFTPETA